ncbi:MAG: uracil-DNA glycosylase [Pseudomonadota bacterium]
MTSASERRTIFLEEIGVGPLWTKRDRAPMAPAAAAQADAAAPAEAVEQKAQSSAWGASPELPAVNADAPSAAEIAEMDWNQLKTAVAGCTRCDLCRSRTKTVFGTGDEKAKWLFVGEGPGRNEDLQGEPFVGPAGKLLDNMLLAMSLKRGENAYIANIVKCRPVGADGKDRAPTADEAAACRPYLDRQIALLKPAIIVALGKTAAVSLLGVDQDITVAQLRGEVKSHAGLPLVVTYHPAYLLRKPVDKRKTWSDLCLAMNAYDTKP